LKKSFNIGLFHQTGIKIKEFKMKLFLSSLDNLSGFRNNFIAKLNLLSHLTAVVKMQKKKIVVILQKIK
jgi:hypothetical protein